MIEILFATLVFYAAGLMLPSLVGVLRKELNLDFLVGPRDEQPEVSAVVQRIRRSSANLQESLLIFIPLALLAISSQAGVAETATIWLGLRVAYLITYAMGLRHVRTIIWTISMVYLYLMGAALV
ncbi:MAG: MAPEG family protein [Alphaproteobacteria bacterium]|nr:MAPEG family protein [Alphaproteobacteria bacterium]